MAVPNVVPRAVVITVGDELLLGDTVDSNAARIGKVLAGLGAPVVRKETVGDEAAAIRVAVARPGRRRFGSGDRWARADSR